MVAWRDILSKLLSEWKELTVVCGCRDEDAEREIAQLPREPPEEPVELSSCSACMLRELLESSYVVQVPISSALSESMVYVLDDCVVEISEDCGYLISKKNAGALIKVLEDLGFETSALKSFLGVS